MLRVWSRNLEYFSKTSNLEKLRDKFFSCFCYAFSSSIVKNRTVGFMKSVRLLYTLDIVAIYLSRNQLSERQTSYMWNKLSVHIFCIFFNYKIKIFLLLFPWLEAIILNNFICTKYCKTHTQKCCNNLGLKVSSFQERHHHIRLGEPRGRLYAGTGEFTKNVRERFRLSCL